MFKRNQVIEMENKGGLWEQAKGKLAAAGTAVGTAMVSGYTWAIDTTAVGTAIDGAKADGLTVGEMVIAAVAGLVVVGIILALVRKL